MPASTLITCLLIGAVAGTIAALCGVGGGVIMVPCYVAFLGMEQKNAVATSLMAMIGTALIASMKNHSNGLGDVKLAAITTAGAVVLTYFATDWLKTMSNQRLSQLFGLLLVVTGARMLWLGKA